MRDKDKPPLGISIAGWVFSLAMFFAHRSYVEKHGRLPGQINAWHPEGLPGPPVLSVPRPVKLEQDRYGRPKVAPNHDHLEKRDPNAGPDIWDGYRWRYRR
jgi:hypothetical protein